VQQGKFAIKAPGNARVDWHILRALGEYLDINLPYNKLSEIRKSLSQVSPHFAHSNYTKTFMLPETIHNLNESLYLKNVPLNSTIDNFYMTDSISKSSYIMALCTNRFLVKTTNFLKE
jgi:NADH dehydrogenase/NADH:ubiquinone oxidoreductase subunit G